MDEYGITPDEYAQMAIELFDMWFDQGDGIDLRGDCLHDGLLASDDFRIRCGKGTYIRSIARDFGLALGSGAFLAALRREQIGDYTLTDALPIEDIVTFFTH